MAGSLPGPLREFNGPFADKDGGAVTGNAVMLKKYG